jgi:predicted lipoprotein
MKALIKTIVPLVAVIAALGLGCTAAKSPASKEHTPVAKTAPVKVPKNDPDHIHYIYPDGTVVSQVWTNSVR